MSPTIMRRAIFSFDLTLSSFFRILIVFLLTNSETNVSYFFLFTVAGTVEKAAAAKLPSAS